MNSTSNHITPIEVAQLILCIIGLVTSLAGIVTLTPAACIVGVGLILSGLGCFALQQALAD
ncbi:MAG: hypothetical protein RJA22_3377 [Verrucomicrobiota bacterium]